MSIRVEKIKTYLFLSDGRVLSSTAVDEHDDLTLDELLDHAGSIARDDYDSEVGDEGE